MKKIKPMAVSGIAVFLVLLLMGQQAAACTTCNPPLQSAIFSEGFGLLCLYMLLPFALVALLCIRLNKLK